MDKKILTFNEALQYTGFSASHFHKLTAAGEVPCSKPTGKSLFFDREELERWLMSRRKPTRQEQASTAALFVNQ